MPRKRRAPDPTEKSDRDDDRPIRDPADEGCRTRRSPTFGKPPDRDRRAGVTAVVTRAAPERTRLTRRRDAESRALDGNVPIWRMKKSAAPARHLTTDSSRDPAALPLGPIPEEPDRRKILLDQARVRRFIDNYI